MIYVTITMARHVARMDRTVDVSRALTLRSVLMSDDLALPEHSLFQQTAI